MAKHKIISLLFLIFIFFCLNKTAFAQEEIDISEETNKSYTKTGIRQYKAGNYQAAIESWNKIPENSKYHEKAQQFIEMAKEKIAEAAEGSQDKEAEKRSIKTNSYSEYLKYGKEYYQQKEYDKAIESYSNALKFKPDNYNLAYNIALIYHKKDDSYKARKYVYKSLSINPDFQEAIDLKKKIEKSISKSEEEPGQPQTSPAKGALYLNSLTRKEATTYPLVNEAVFRSIIPGLGQFYNKRIIRGWIYLSAEAAALTSFIIFRGRGNDYEDQYNQTEDIHDLINSITYNKATENIKYSNFSLGFVYGIIAVSILDAGIDAYFTGKKIKRKLKMSNKIDKNINNIGLSYSF